MAWRKDRKLKRDDDRICSCHFKHGLKENGPTLFPWNQDKIMDFPDPSKRPCRSTAEQPAMQEKEMEVCGEACGGDAPLVLAKDHGPYASQSSKPSVPPAVPPAEPPAYMKAVVVEKHGGPDVMSVQQRPLPTPGDNQVLIKVMTAGVNPLDADLRGGDIPGSVCPYIPGSDLAGYVVQLGANVTGITVGEPVYTSPPSSFTGHAAYAEYAAVDSSVVHPLPYALNFSQGACLGSPYFSAYRALFTRGEASPGHYVLIHGASGGVGSAACGLARARGLHVVGTAGSEAGRQVAKACGAHAVFSHSDPKQCVTDIQHYMGSRKFEVILEMKAESNLHTDLELIAEGGRIVIVGSHGNIAISPEKTMFMECDIRGLNCLRLSQGERAEAAAAVARGVEQGWLRPPVAQEFPLTEASHAHRALAQPRTGNLILSAQ